MDLTGKSSAPACTKCDGSGTIRIDEFTYQQCICSYARQLKTHLGPELWSAETPKQRILWAPEENGTAGIDKTIRNMFLKGGWSKFLPHVKWALACKGPNFYFKVVDALRLKQVWLGKEGYQSKSKSKRDSVETFNSLSDLIGEDYNLVIIRLGEDTWKNVAMPSILKEALMIRQMALLPTWIIEEPASIFGPGHHSYSDDVASYIKRNSFEILELGQSGEPEMVEVDHSGEVSLGNETQRQEKLRPKSAFVRPREDEADTPGETKDWKKKRNDWKKRNGGGGPAGIL